MGTQLIFIDGANDAYMNSIENYRGCSMSSDDYVDVYFKAAAVGNDGDNVTGYDKVQLNVSDEKHAEVMQAIASSMAPNPRRNYVTVADDVNSTYVSQFISSITSITRSATGTWENVEAVTANLILTAADSGKTFFCNPAATTAFTLPTITSALKGWNCTIIATEGIDATATGMDNIINIHAGAGNDDFIGIIVDSNDGVGDYAVANDDYINITDSAGPGSKVDIICDGSRYYAYGVTNEAAQVLFNSAAAA